MKNYIISFIRCELAFFLHCIIYLQLESNESDEKEEEWDKKNEKNEYTNT